MPNASIDENTFQLPGSVDPFRSRTERRVVDQDLLIRVQDVHQRFACLPVSEIDPGLSQSYGCLCLWQHQNYFVIGPFSAGIPHGAAGFGKRLEFAKTLY